MEYETQEVLATADEVIVAFASRDETEFKELSQTAEMVGQLCNIYQKQEEDAKNTILALTGQCENLEVDLEKNSEATQVIRHQQSLQELLVAEEHAGKVKEQLSATEKRKEELQNEAVEIKEKQKTVSDKTTVGLPNLRHDINLYSYITKIRWQYDAPEDEVKGYIANKKNPRAFSLNKKDNSQFFITNLLWEQMESSW